MPTATRNQAMVAVGPSTASNASSSALASASITTSEQLVKTLRVPQPPPNGVSKIDIASEAWLSDSFFVPKKADLLSQWTLEYLCSSLKASPSASAPGTPNKGKNKAKQQTQQQSTSTGAVELDLKAWQLLSSIVTAQTSNEADLSEASKRSWLSHLANTQPVLALAGAFAKRIDQHQLLELPQREELLASAAVSLVKLLPLATSRTAATNIEAATDSIQAWLDFFAQSWTVTEQQSGLTILQSIVNPWTTALQYGSNAKRNHQHFCSHAIPSLLRACHALGAGHIGDDVESTRNASLLEVVQRIAVESLFTEEVQRSLLQASRSKQITAEPTWKEANVATAGVVSQLLGFMQDQQLTSATLSSMTTLTDLLCAKLHRSEALNSVVTPSNTTSGTVREAQLSLKCKTMLSEWLFPLLPHLVASSDATTLRTERAAARRGLLQSVESNSLYVIGCEELEEWRSLFSTLFDSIRVELLQVVTDTSTTSQAEVADHFGCLTTLWQLEKSVVEDDLTSIFAMVAAQQVSKQALWLSEELPTPTLAALDFFRAVAAIDARFRTIPNLVNTVLGSLSFAAELSAQTLRDEPFSSSLFTSQIFLAELGKLCRDNVTPMQVSELIHRLTALSQGLNSVLQDGKLAQASKKRRIAQGSPSKTNSSNAREAAALTAQLQVAAHVLQSVNLVPTLRARSVAAAEELHNDLILPCIDACLSSKQGTTSSQPIHGVAAAALRVRQALLSEKWRYDPSEPVKLDGSLPSESLPCLETAFDERADSLIELLSIQDAGPQLCQLQFQIVQSLLQRAERDLFLGLKESRYCRLISEDEGAIFDLLSGLSSAGGDSVKATCKGCPDRIEGREELDQALWLAITTRWAPLVDAIAHPRLITSLAQTLLLSSDSTSQKEGMHYITSTALRNASFLELANWRKHVIAAIQRELASQAALDRRLTSTAPLWSTPAEWVNKSARGPLLRDLLALDRDLTAAQQQAKTSGRILTASWTELRNLLARVQGEYATEGSVSDEDLFASLEAFLSLQHSGADAHMQQAWELATLAAIKAIVRVLLARGKQNASISERLIGIAEQVRGGAVSEGTIRITLKMRASQEVFALLSSLPTANGGVHQRQDGRALASLGAIAKLSSAKIETFGDVVQALDVSLYHLREVRLVADGRQEVLTSLSTDVVRSLCVVFGRADVLLKATSGETDARQILRPAADVTLELLRCIDACGQSLTGSVVAACLAYSALIASLNGLQEHKRVVGTLERIVSRQSGEGYEAVLTSILAVLRTTVEAKDAASDRDQAALIRTVGVVLGSAPEGTSKVARSHLSTWLATLNTNVASSGGRLNLLSIVAGISALDTLCSYHAMLLRAQDMGAVLQLFATVTGPSMADEPSSTLVSTPRSELVTIRTKIFDGIVSTLSSVMRLRQDLVLGFLPQLALLLARLCTLFRQLRRSSSGRIEASGTQRRALRRDLPAWLDPVLVPPLSHHEARTLSRLLSNLVVKNVSLKHRSSGTAKAESLARAFSKHATYVLVAYLRSLTGTGATVEAKVRTELEVGMMTVCEVMGTRQRDAAMVGWVDAAGRVLLKRLWGVYEKQRYKGQ